MHLDRIHPLAVFNACTQNEQLSGILSRSHCQTNSNVHTSTIIILTIGKLLIID